MAERLVVRGRGPRTYSLSPLLQVLMPRSILLAATAATLLLAATALAAGAPASVADALATTKDLSALSGILSKVSQLVQCVFRGLNCSHSVVVLAALTAGPTKPLQTPSVSPVQFPDVEAKLGNGFTGTVLAPNNKAMMPRLPALRLPVSYPSQPCRLARHAPLCLPSCRPSPP